MPDRRRFVQTMGLAALAPFSLAGAAPPRPAPRASAEVVRPPRLRPGNTVGLISPSSAVAEDLSVQIAVETVEAMGLEPRLGAYVRARYGYLSGRDSERAADLNAMFADDSIDAIFALRGGWGAARLLPLLDWDAISANPKILLGYSDITALLNPIFARTGLITFHGPMGTSDWGEFPVEHLRTLLFEAGTPTLGNPVRITDSLVQTEHRVEVITPGRARGQLVGGNLTVLTALLGSPYLPEWDGKILFLEDVGENLYRIDRMITQLKLAGVLDRIAGFVFGKCTDCGPGEGYGSLTLMQLFRDHVAPLGIPAWSGAMIGHIDDQWVLPVGGEVEIDAVKGTIEVLHPVVS
ncbi:MAG TPA: LD-carboxypeptidase [Longimicrobiaceae bacterium]|nr:LD-carboxypeptidase [Longimicrobiaceae bacterium]